ncbi:MAG: hypothetical protein J2P54_08785 [Bradyrhizobiaceae bacterium]|nr:hypothetical protein [Bradyrhizobiaceae bacterium]
MPTITEKNKHRVSAGALGGRSAPVTGVSRGNSLRLGRTAVQSVRDGRSSLASVYAREAVANAIAAAATINALAAIAYAVAVIVH